MLTGIAELAEDTPEAPGAELEVKIWEHEDIHIEPLSNNKPCVIDRN
jgi:hypothetical protein